MKLVTFNQTNRPSRTSGRNQIPRIGFGKSGTVYFNQPAIDLMGLKEGDKIALSKEEDEPTNWWIHLNDNGFPLRKNSKGDNLLFQSSAMVHEYVKFFNAEGKTVSCQIAGEPTEMKKVKYWCILTPVVI